MALVSSHKACAQPAASSALLLRECLASLHAHVKEDQFPFTSMWKCVGQMADIKTSVSKYSLLQPNI